MWYNGIILFTWHLKQDLGYWRDAQKPSLRNETERGQLKSKELEAERKESGKATAEGWGSNRGGKTRIMPMFVSFLSLWHFRGQWVCVPVCVQVCFYVLISFSIQPICGIDPLPNSEQNKSQPKPTIIYYIDGGEGEREGESERRSGEG